MILGDMGSVRPSPRLSGWHRRAPAGGGCLCPMHTRDRQNDPWPLRPRLVMLRRPPTPLLGVVLSDARSLSMGADARRSWLIETLIDQT